MVSASKQGGVISLEPPTVYLALKSKNWEFFGTISVGTSGTAILLISSTPQVTSTPGIYCWNISESEKWKESASALLKSGQRRTIWAPTLEPRLVGLMTSGNPNFFTFSHSITGAPATTVRYFGIAKPFCFNNTCARILSIATVLATGPEPVYGTWNVSNKL